MKKLTKLFVLCSILIFMLLMAACDGTQPDASTDKPTAAPTEEATEKPTEAHVCSEYTWTVTVRPTCTQEGERENTCECGKLFKTESIAPLGHTVGDPATCTTAQICTVCVVELEPALGHSPGAVPSCSAAQVCTVCEIELTPALPHIPGDEADCTNAQICTVCNTEIAAPLGHTVEGELSCLEALTCSVCGEVLAQRLEHTRGPAATCTTPMICTVCDTVLLEAKGHTPMNTPSCTSSQKCAVCREVIAEPIPHAPGKEATCTEPQTCLYCHTVLADAFGHTAGDEATCDTSQRCTVCRAVLVKAFGHTIETDDAVESTCTEAGLTEGKHCSVCLEVLVAQIVLPPHHRFVNNICEGCGYEVSGSEGLEFTSNKNGTCYVSGIGSCEATDVTIPAAAPNGETVVAIGTEAFKNNTKITGIEMPDTVTSIGDGAFDGCTFLSSLKMSPYITHIGSYAFAGCDALASVTLPENLISIADHAFYSSGITELVIPEKVTSVGDSAFSSCNELSYLRIDASITECGQNIFWSNYNLQTVYIGEKVTYVDHTYLFDGCFRLVEVINLSSTEVRDTVCQYVIEVHEEESKIINENDFLFYTYGGKHYLVGYVGEDIIISLPESCNGEKYEIVEYAFQVCKDIVSVRLSSKIARIANSAFSGCNKIVEVIENGYHGGHLGVGKTESGYVAYNAIEIHNEAESKIENIDGYLFYPYINREGQMYNYLVGYVGNDTDLVLPESYHGEAYSIYKWAFSGNENIRSVNIGSNVTSIRENAFRGCSELTRVVINEGVMFIYDFAFSNCKKLSNVHLPSSLHYIESYAFSYCTGLEKIVIPEGVYYIGGSAFYGCTGIEEIEIPDSVTQIEDWAFAGCTSLINVYIPDSVSHMGREVFKGSPKLIVHCAAKEKPTNWDAEWKEQGIKVDWGAILEVPVE